MVCCIYTFIFIKQIDRHEERKEASDIGITCLVDESVDELAVDVLGLMKLIAIEKLLLNKRSNAKLNLRSIIEDLSSSGLVT